MIVLKVGFQMTRRSDEPMTRFTGRSVPVWIGSQANWWTEWTNKIFVHPFVHHLNPYFTMSSDEQDESAPFFNPGAEWKTIPLHIPLHVSLFRSNEFGGTAESGVYVRVLPVKSARTKLEVEDYIPHSLSELFPWVLA